MVEHRVSVRCGRRIRQLRKKSCVAPQPPAINGLDTVEPGGGVRIWETPFAQLGTPSLEIGRLQAEQFGNYGGSNIAAGWNASRAAHDSSVASSQESDFPALQPLLSAVESDGELKSLINPRPVTPTPKPSNSACAGRVIGRPQCP
jgi:hypothetical protein